MKSIKKSLIIWRILSGCYFVLIFLSILPIAVMLQQILGGVWLFEKSFLLSTAPLILSSMMFTFITVCFRAFLIKKSPRCILRSPCRIKMNLYREEDILSLLSKKVRIKRIDNICWYGKERLKRELRVLIFSLHEDDHNNDLSIAEQYVRRINEKTRFPTLIDKEMHQNMGRIQLFLYNEVPQMVLNSAARSVEDNIEQSEFLVNIFIGLNEGALYIPFCCSRLIGVGRLYQYAINRVAEWLNIENDNASTINMIP